ncbi:MAG: penicillin-binding transpeptidase domain-containing protein, partial [Pseudomonadota bacterium]
LAALHHHVGNPWEHMMCPGYFTLPGNDHRYRDWWPQGHGPVNLSDSIAQSCDVYFYALALELGIDRMHDFLAQFGFGDTTGIDIQGEKSGLLPSREWKRRALQEAWFPGETIITGIGQGFMLATPLQLAHATATVAARGQRFAPSLVSAVRDPVTGEITPRKPRPLDPVETIDADNWKHIVTAMDEVVNGLRGTARAIGIDAPMRIAGKTGTAQVFTVAQDDDYDADEVDELLRDHALFVGFAPVELPRVAIAVLVENGGSGSSAAAPVARAVLDEWHRQERLLAAGDSREAAR